MSLSCQNGDIPGGLLQTQNITQHYSYRTLSLCQYRVRMGTSLGDSYRLRASHNITATEDSHCVTIVSEWGHPWGTLTDSEHHTTLQLQKTVTVSVSCQNGDIPGGLLQTQNITQHYSYRRLSLCQYRVRMGTSLGDSYRLRASHNITATEDSHCVTIVSEWGHPWGTLTDSEHHTTLQLHNTVTVALSCQNGDIPGGLLQTQSITQHHSYRRLSLCHYRARMGTSLGDSYRLRTSQLQKTVTVALSCQNGDIPGELLQTQNITQHHSYRRLSLWHYRVRMGTSLGDSYRLRTSHNITATEDCHCVTIVSEWGHPWGTLTDSEHHTTLQLQKTVTVSLSCQNGDIPGGLLQTQNITQHYSYRRLSLCHYRVRMGTSLGNSYRLRASHNITATEDCHCATIVSEWGHPWGTLTDSERHTTSQLQKTVTVSLSCQNGDIPGGLLQTPSVTQHYSYTTLCQYRVRMGTSLGDSYRLRASHNITATEDCHCVTIVSEWGHPLGTLTDSEHHTTLQLHNTVSVSCQNGDIPGGLLQTQNITQHYSYTTLCQYRVRMGTSLGDSYRLRASHNITATEDCHCVTIVSEWGHPWGTLTDSEHHTTLQLQKTVTVPLSCQNGDIPGGLLQTQNITQHYSYTTLCQYRVRMGTSLGDSYRLRASHNITATEDSHCVTIVSEWGHPWGTLTDSEHHTTLQLHNTVTVALSCQNGDIPGGLLQTQSITQHYSYTTLSLCHYRVRMGTSLGDSYRLRASHISALSAA